mgnify:FL=1
MEEKRLSIDTTNIDSKNKNIAQKILDAEDLDELKDLTALFNINNQKRNALRILKMNNLLDDVTDNIIQRFEKNPHNFSNDDLLKYLQVTENAIDRATKNLNMVEETPAIQMMQNNQVNININDGLDRESRLRVTDTVKQILNKLSTMTDSDNSVIEINPEDN